MYSVLWFRHGLRLHDNPALAEALNMIKSHSEGDVRLLPIFIFDGHSAGTKLCGYNRFQFLLECLEDLDQQFRKVGGRLFVARGSSIDIFNNLNRYKGGISSLSFEQDCEPCWKTRDEAVKLWCLQNGVKCSEQVGHTLWNPHDVIAANGGSPPLTFSMFRHVIDSMGLPQRPIDDEPDFEGINFAEIDDEIGQDIGLFMGEKFPTPEDFGVVPEHSENKVYVGGERIALEQLKIRLDHERDAFAKCSFQPNQRNPDILCPPKSLSPDLRFGSLSVRKFYWALVDSYKEVTKKKKASFMVTSQLLWREFFYTMSVNNEFFDEMEQNAICISIPWAPHEDNPHWYAFVEARTGFPFIDAGLRQLYKEGWIHHFVRNALACFLTRGDLWISWEPGLKLFLKHLLDADWSVCAGNWMWISSSAFEQVFNCQSCVNPGYYGRRTDPWGEYIKRYVPELAKYPVEYIYEPWKAPIEVQKKSGCILGKDYPKRIVKHEVAVKENMAKMNKLQQALLTAMTGQVPLHCAPSDEEEVRKFMSFPESCSMHLDVEA